MLTWDNYRVWLGDQWRCETMPKIDPPLLSAISTDSRTIKPGNWFLPLSGPNFDGHDFIKETITKGAAGFFFSRATQSKIDPQLIHYGVAVSDPLTAFQKAASGWRSTLTNLCIFALTGSSGKTTTKEMLTCILKKAGKTLANQASFNNEIGVPKTIAMLAQDDQFAAIEMGARHTGNIKFLCELVRPNIAALLNVGSAHIGEFGSFENLLNTKLEIFRNSPEKTICISPMDDLRIFEAARSTGKKIISFGYSSKSDIQIIKSDWNSNGSMDLIFRTPFGQIETFLPFAHQAYPINAAAACAMAVAGGIGAQAITEGLSSFTGTKGRFQIFRKENHFIIDDTYNANPESMRAGLQTLSRLFTSLKKIVILGDMLELGDRSSSEHKIIGEFCATIVKPEFIFAIGKHAEHISSGANSAGFPKQSISVFENVSEFLEEMPNLFELGDVIYAKASNSLKLSRIIEALIG